MFEFASNYNDGVSLLEMLLVITVIAVISLLAINHYHIMQQNALLVAVQTDKKMIDRALDDYFYQTGCYQNGVFSKLSGNATQYQPDIVRDLGLTAEYQQRQPLVQQYSALIIDTGQKTLMDNPPKPIYYLEITAKLNVTNDQMPWYQKQFDAAGYTGTTLYWRSLSDNSYVQPRKQLWVLDGSRQLFRRVENNPNANSPVIAGSYCVN